MRDRLDNDAVVDCALAALRAMGVSTGEVFLQDAEWGSLEVKEGTVESVEASGERGISLRVMDNHRVGFAFTSDLSVAGIRACADHAKSMADVTDVDPLFVVAPPLAGDADVDLGIYDPGIERREPRQFADLALAADEAAHAADPRLVKLQKSKVFHAAGSTTLATTGAVRAGYRESYVALHTVAVAEAGGERQMGQHWEAARRFDELRPARVGRRAGLNAVEMLRPRTLRTQCLPIILDPSSAAHLLRAIAPILSADSVVKRRSVFAGKLGHRVASEAVTIADDARRPGGIGSTPFDGEGVATAAKTLVKRGVLCAYLTSLKTARRLQLDHAGNTRRSSYKAPGVIGPSNLYIEPGAEDPAALTRGVERGLAITSFLNAHSIDRVSGEFSLGATGHYVERGVRVYPVHRITIAGNLVRMLNTMIGVGSDLVFLPGGFGSPTLITSELSIGGASA